MPEDAMSRSTRQFLQPVAKLTVALFTIYDFYTTWGVGVGDSFVSSFPRIGWVFVSGTLGHGVFDTFAAEHFTLFALGCSYVWCDVCGRKKGQLNYSGPKNTRTCIIPGCIA